MDDIDMVDPRRHVGNHALFPAAKTFPVDAVDLGSIAEIPIDSLGEERRINTSTDNSHLKGHECPPFRGKPKNRS
jgi:hypothetical protein